MFSNKTGQNKWVVLGSGLFIAGSIASQFDERGVFGVKAAPGAAGASKPTPNEGTKIKLESSGKTSAAPVKMVTALPKLKAPVVGDPVPVRPDPFEPIYYPTPTPSPTPVPIIAPEPVVLPTPPAALPPAPYLPPNSPPLTAWINLPPPVIGRYAPARAPRYSTASSAQPPASRSPNKRVSGIIIGDSVRALLEISVGTPAGGGAAAPGGNFGGGEGGTATAEPTTITRVVQPGDEVDGIKILRIERMFENGRQVTRMFIREGNEERFVDLKAAPTPPANAVPGAEGLGQPSGADPRFPGSGSSGPGAPSFGGRRPGGIVPANRFGGATP